METDHVILYIHISYIYNIYLYDDNKLGTQHLVRKTFRLKKK